MCFTTDSPYSPHTLTFRAPLHIDYIKKPSFTHQSHVYRETVEMILILLFGLFIQDGLALPSDRSLNVGRDSRYSGYKVLAVIPNTKEQVSWLAEFKGNPSLNCSLDWWNEPSLPAVTVSLAVNPSCLEDVIQEFKNEGLSARVRIPDLEKVIALEKNYRFLSQLYRNPDDWNEEVYHNLEEINKRVDSLVKTYSEVLTAKTLATTYEGRKIEVVIAREAGPVNKPVIWIDCGIHAREWISPPTCLHIIDRLVDSVNSVDPKENLLAVYDFYILPVANPDGYAYTWSTDRMWRKNRKPNPGANNLQSPFFGWNGNQNQKCDGSDPNRNFPVHFNEASNNPCDGSFRGETPFSEAEAQAVRNGVQQMQDIYGKNKIAAFITIHANSQLWMSPHGN